MHSSKNMPKINLLNFRGSQPGLAQHNKCLADVKEARKDPTKRQFERNFLKWFHGQSDIQCFMCEEDCRRRSKKDPKEGIAMDLKEDEEWNDSCLYPNELPKQSDDEE